MQELIRNGKAVILMKREEVAPSLANQLNPALEYFILFLPRRALKGFRTEVERDSAVEAFLQEGVLSIFAQVKPRAKLDPIKTNKKRMERERAENNRKVLENYNLKPNKT